MKNMIIISSKKNPFYIRQRYNSLIWLEQRVISDPGGMYNNFLYTHQIAGFMSNYWVQATSFNNNDLYYSCTVPKPAGHSFIVQTGM